MKVGDLVKFYDGINDDNRTGLILEIVNWVDKGAPDRNFGTDIKVLWSDGEKMLCHPEELITYSEDNE